MTKDDITKIEVELGVSLPQFYIDLVTSYPPELSETEAPDYGLLDDPETIIHR